MEAVEVEVTKSFNDLIFVKYTKQDFYEIPKYLFEQVEGRSWTVERLYTYAHIFLKNKSMYFWVFEDDEQIKGVLWFVIDVLSEKVNVIVFSVDEEYKENSLEIVRKFLHNFIEKYNELTEKTKLKERINWVTNRPEVFEKLGGHIPETIMVEL